MRSSHIVRKCLTTCIVIAVCSAGRTPAQTTVYVDGSVAATGDGTQAAPFKTIAEALARTDASLTILVAGGTYVNEPNNTDVRSGQTLIGSYDSSFTTSDPSVTPTLIDMSRLYHDQNGAFTMNGVSEWTLMNVVIQNSSTGEHGDTENGGAIYIRNGSQGALRGMTFYNCTARFEGGYDTGTARDGGALCIRDDSTVVIEDCVFDSCTAVGSGGAMRIRSARGGGNNVKIRRCLFTHCGSRNGASVIDDADGASQIEIVNCLFAHNGVDVVNAAGTYPSNFELRVADKRTLIYNCTFVGSNNPDGFVISVGNSADAAATKEIVNCIFAENAIASDSTTFALFNYGSDYDDTTVLENNLFFSNSGLDPLDPAGAALIGVNNNLAGDPRFADAANGDYHLMPGSPGEDAGRTLAIVPDDFAGTGRPVGSAYDIGALEGQVNPPSYYVPSVVATASSSLSPASGPEKTVDGWGLNALDQHDTATANMWVSKTGQEPPVWIQYKFDMVYKLDRMWVWNSNSDLESLVLGWGVKTATIETSTDGASWVALADVPEFAQAPGTPDYTSNTTVDFNGVAAKFVRLTCTSSWGGGNQYSLSEVRFSYIPVSAYAPYPPNGAVDVSADVTLSWTAGREAALHEIHFGTDVQAVTDSTTPIETVSEATYAADLQPDTTYYWKVVEVNETESPSAWSSPVWSFSTSPCLVIDDFESYGQLSPTQVFQTWLDSLGFPPDEFFPDGYGGNGTGAIVGNDPGAGPIMEYTVVHGGHRSMPLFYSGLSEITRTFEPARDWTRGGVKTLVLFFCGTATNEPAELYVKINNTRVSYKGNAGDLTSTEWKQWNIDLPSSAGLGAVKSLTIGVSAGQGALYIDDIALYRTAPSANP